MDWFTSITAEQWTAAGTWATVLIALVAATFGLRQVREARRLREDQAQPYVVAIMEQNPTSPNIIEIAFRNYGATAARKIQVTSTPRLRCTDGGGGIQDVWVPEVIPMLAPGQEWRTFWDDGPARLDCDGLKGEDAHQIEITYAGVEGTRPQKTTSILDWSAHRGRLFVGAKTIDDAATALSSIAATLMSWSDEQGSLAVFGRDGDAKDIRLAERHRDRLAKHHEVVARLQGAQAGPDQPDLNGGP